jgi:hypothetical protein
MLILTKVAYTTGLFTGTGEVMSNGENIPPPPDDFQYPPPPDYEQKPQPMNPAQTQKKSHVIPIALVVIIIVIVVILATVFIIMPAVTPEYQKYSVFSSSTAYDQTTVYKNDVLGVSIEVRTVTYNSYIFCTAYLGEESIASGNGVTIAEASIEAYSSVVSHSEVFTTEQIKWFEYVCNNVL